MTLRPAGRMITVSHQRRRPNAELRGYWHKPLADGATITAAARNGRVGRQSFGMLVDRFGTPWLVNIAQTACRSLDPTPARKLYTKVLT
jgi:PhnB protein